MPLQHLINHVALVVDKSASMTRHASRVIDVFDRELNALKQRSVDVHQETRISIYLFDDNIEVLTFDMDVMRFTSLKDYYKIGGNTALIDATVQAITDHRKLPELYGDHAFLTYVITDGEENRSRKNTSGSLITLLNSLPDNWTNAILVPNQSGANLAQRFGFNAGSISVWDTASANALDSVGKQFTGVMTNYMAMRSSGVRGTKNLFTLDSTNLTPNLLDAVKDYDIFRVEHDIPIRTFIEQVTGQPYRIGSAFYEPAKTVEIQDHKKLFVQDLKTRKVYGGQNLRSLLGLPATTAKVDPGVHKDWRIFVQSTSTNRKLHPGTHVLVTY